MAITEQFAGLDMQNLIGGPLSAAADASIQMARSTSDFINDVGFDANGKIRTAAFGYERRSTNDDGTSNLEELKVAVPILAIVPIPNLQIDEVNILFDMEVKQSEKSDKSTDLGASLSGQAKFGPIKVSITGNVSSHSSNTRSSDNSAKYHVDVRATNHGTPEGLARVLDMMAACISPVLVSSELKDGNGQALDGDAKNKAEKLKSIRENIALLENQLDSSKTGLDSALQKLKNLGTTQQNIYQASLTNAISKLDKTKDADTIKTYNSALDQVNQTWNNFRNSVADDVKLIADSQTDNDKTTVSSIFGLKAFTDKYEVGDYSNTDAEYSAILAAQNAAVDAQNNYDKIQDSLLSKRMEYNNAMTDNSSASGATGGGSEDDPNKKKSGGNS